MRRRPLVRWLPLLVAAACRSAPGASHAAASAPAEPLPAADLAAIRASDTAFSSAIATGDAARVAEVYAPDARLLPPNAATVEGRAAIQQFWAGLLGAYALKINVVSDEIEGRGDLAYARGHYLLDGTAKGKGGPPLHDEGKYLEILRRQPDGSWRLAVDMYSSNLSAPVGR